MITRLLKLHGPIYMNVLRRHFSISGNYLAKAVVRPTSHRWMSAMNSKACTGAKRIVWLDMEMTGLDIDKDHILEIACLVSDSQLNIVATGPNLIIHQPNDVLNNMNEWCINQHGESGLTMASRNSKITIKDAEEQILNFVKAHVPEKRCPLGGNSVYMDRLFIMKYMPRLNNYLHYRIIDVSTIKELAKRWYSSEYSRVPQKTFKHRAIDDIKESIEELKYYRENIFKNIHTEYDN